MAIAGPPSAASQRADPFAEDPGTSIPVVPAPIEEKLRELTAFLDAIVENIPDMIFVKDAKTLIFERFNRAGEALIGRSRQELIGKSDYDVYPKDQADFFVQKDRETLRGKKLVEIPEEPLLTQNGTRWLHTKKVPILDEHGEPRYLLGISEDITVRKLAEERVHALSHELAAVVRHAREAIISWDLFGRIVSWNGAAEALYAIPEKRALGTMIETLVPESERPAFRAAQKQLLAGEPPSLSDVYRLCNGIDVEVEESLFLIRDAAGSPVRIGSIARDVGEVARLRRATEIFSRSDLPLAEDEETRSPAMREALEAAYMVAQKDSATVLLLGETGAGKGWLARRVHAKSQRAGKAYFEVNCASLGPELVESELFGHERGAFTGADSQKRGLVEVAEGGTLFLDEVGELPPLAQAKLLSFLDSKTFRRVGGLRNLPANVRLLSATNIDLLQAVERGRFRRDLYYRLSVVPIRVPPLRERGDDLPALCRRLLRDLSGGAQQPALSQPVLDALQRYPWPGNVRELRNTLERALILSRGAPIGLFHLPAELRVEQVKKVPARGRIEDVERQHIVNVLEAALGNRTRAAAILGISRSTLKRKLKELGLNDQAGPAGPADED
jgi:PAS domain S-box-containing protein